MQVSAVLDGHTLFQTGQDPPKFTFYNIKGNCGRLHAEVVLLKVVRSLCKLCQTVLPHGLPESEFMSESLWMRLDEVGDASGTVPGAFGTEVFGERRDETVQVIATAAVHAVDEQVGLGGIVFATLDASLSFNNKN